MNINSGLIGDIMGRLPDQSDLSSGKDNPFMTETSEGFAYKFTDDVIARKDPETGSISFWSTEHDGKSKNERVRVVLRLACAAYFHNTYMTKYEPVLARDLERMEEGLRQRSVIEVSSSFAEACRFFYIFNEAASSTIEPTFHRSTPIDVGALVLQLLKSEDKELEDRWDKQKGGAGKSFRDTFSEMYDSCVGVGISDYLATATTTDGAFHTNWKPTAQWLEKKMEEVRSEMFDDKDEHTEENCPCLACRMVRAAKKVEELVSKLEEKL